MNVTLEMDAPAKVPNTTKQKILLVDDDPAIRQILVRLLSEENFTALTAANGVEALALSSTVKFDLVLLDLNMPVKNGWETFEQMSARDPLLPIILITARPNQFFPALASGVGALLEKPLDFTKLFQTIHDLLEEPEEERLARLSGRSAAFSYIPPLTNMANGKLF
jgi:DNA-binding response OmpR family regulator